jgi:2'-5' RNA ligase
MAHSLYFVALLPPKDIRQEVTAFKQEAAERFGSSYALKSPPHITLVPPFRYPADEEPTLHAALTEAASRVQPFSVQLRSFARFDQRVIFVDVLSDETLDFCQRVTAEVFHQRADITPEVRSFHPHMTVAFRDLTRPVFPAAWAHFSALTYEREFTAGALTLLRHSGQRWEVLTNAGFG